MDWHAAGYDLAWEDIRVPRWLIQRAEPVRISDWTFTTHTLPIILDEQRNIARHANIVQDVYFGQSRSRVWTQKQV